MDSLLHYQIFPAILVGYYFVVWLFVGRDPKPGVIVSQYASPAGMSPAEMRYLLTRASDRKTVAAVLAHLSANKVISIHPEQDRYRITLLVDSLPASIPPEEASAFTALQELASFETPNEKNPRTLFLEPGKGKNLMLVASVVAGSLMKRIGDLYIQRNLSYSLPAVAISVIVAMLTAANFAGRNGVVFLTLWFLFFNLVLGLIFVVNVIPAMRDGIRGMLTPRNIAYTFLPLPIFFAIPALVASRIARLSNDGFALELIALVVIHIWSGTIIQTVTQMARQRMDQVEGFKQFLASVELDPLNRMNDPRLTPALMNEHLAYAIALDLKEAWGDHLSNALFMTTTSAGG